LDGGNSVDLDVAGITNKEQLHALLREHLGFPDHYGCNFDAFRDCITDPAQSRMPVALRLLGLDALASVLPREARLLRQCLEELPLERPEIHVEIA
jgi:ribonuclease inhibitor